MVRSESLPYLYRDGGELPIANTLAETSAEGVIVIQRGVPNSYQEKLVRTNCFRSRRRVVDEEGRHYN